MSQNIRHEVVIALQLLGACVPALLLTQVWRAYLEGVENFSSLNIQQVLTSPFIILPLITTWFHTRLFQQSLD